MVFSDWMHTVTAVFVGDMFALGYGYFLWLAAKADRKHKGDPDSYRKAEREIPRWGWLLGAIPIIVVISVRQLPQ